MTIDDQIRDEKLPYDISKEGAKISALSSSKIHKYEYLTVEDILPSDQQQITQQAKFTYSALGKAFEKQVKTIEDHGQKQVEALKTLKSDDKKLAIDDVIPDSTLNNEEVKKDLEKIKELQKNVDREKFIYKENEYTCSSKTFRTVRTFGRDIYGGRITLKEAGEYQSNLLGEIRNVRDKTRPQGDKKKQGKEVVLKNFF